MKICISAPNYNHRSGGSVALHWLGYLAHKLGHHVFMACNHTNAHWGNYSEIFAEEETDILILPEVIPKFSAHDGIKFVRWVLYYPGVLGGPYTYPAHEQVFCYHPKYRDACVRAAPHGVRDFYLPHAPKPDQTLCDKRGALYWRHKGPERKPPEAHTELTEYFPADKQELYRLLSGAERFYSADPDTIMLEEAAACGCECFVWREGLQRYAEYERSKLPVWRDETADTERVRAFLAQL